MKIADNEISIFYQKTDGQIALNIEQENSDWTIEVVLNDMTGKTAQIAGNKMEEHQEGDQLWLTGQGRSFRILVE